MDHRTRCLNWTLAFVAGGIAGASLALFLAPQSGVVTRGTMGRKLRAGTDSALDLKDRLIRRGKLLREEAEHRVEEAASILAGKRSAAGTRGDAASASDVHDPAVSGA